MQKSTVLDSLFPKTRQQILATTFRNCERRWYLSDLARQLGTQPSSLQRELTNLVAGGLLKKWEEGNRVYYQPETSHPIFPELHQLFIKTAGVVDVLREHLAPFADRIPCAFVYGSIARGEETASSDIDLFIMGDVRLRELVPALRDAERTVQRPVNPSIYSAPEFRAKLAQGNVFLEATTRGAKLFVLGDQDDLGRALEGEPDPGAHHAEGRVGRPAVGDRPRPS